MGSVMANTAQEHLEVGGGRISWLASLDTAYSPEHNYRRSSIIGTIGPKTNSVEAINKLRDAGLNVVRMNFSHGSYDYHQSVIDNTRQAMATHAGRPVAIALDTKGPEIRTGNTKDDVDLPIAAGTVMNFTTDDQYATSCDTKNMYVTSNTTSGHACRSSAAPLEAPWRAIDKLTIISVMPLRNHLLTFPSLQVRRL
jgi:pyruvate kinase